MAIGQRIRFFRNRKGMTQKQLGEVLGFLGKTSDVRMAQYESESRVPKHDLVKEMAGIFDVSTHALTVPDIDTYIGLMHTFFALEDMYGLKIDEMDGEVVLRLDKSDYSTYSSMDKMLRAWLAEAKKLENGESTKEEYDNWRYKYPELDTHQIRAKVPSQEISDMLLAGLKEMENEEKKEIKRKKKKYGGAQQGQPGVHAAQQEDGCHRRPQGETAVHRQVGKVQDGIGDVHAVGQQRVDQALGQGGNDQVGHFALSSFSWGPAAITPGRRPPLPAGRSRRAGSGPAWQWPHCWYTGNSSQ